MKIASSQYNFAYGTQLHYPYSIGTLLAYLQTRMDGLDILPACVVRDQVGVHVDQVAQADVLLCSCYVWNWEITMALASAAKERNPNLFIVCGGPQVPNTPTGFFDRYPFVDALAHGEGEQTLEAVFRRWRTGASVLGPGVSTREGSGGPAERIGDLGALPSPYTTGMIDCLTQGIVGVSWVASWETNRGCPYQCMFCDWGSATYTKLRQYPMDRLLGEIRWFSDRHTVYIDCCDGNFGILPRDRVLARAMKETAHIFGWPKTFRQSWAKNSSEQVIEIAQELQDGGLLTAVGLSVQSLDARALGIVKRKNLSFGRFSELSQQFAAAGLPTYTEVIRGLPGETLQSFKAGLGTLATDSHIGTIYVYNCGVLPNAPMADPAYRRLHGIETVRSPIYLAHSLIHRREMPEFEEIVVATATMSREEMQAAYLFSWAVLLGESLGLLNRIRQAFGERGGDCVRFYDLFLRVCRTDPYAFGREFAMVRAYAAKGYAGEGWDHYDPTWGEVFWPIEEASWLRLANDQQLCAHLGGIADAIADGAGIPRIERAVVEAQVNQLARPTGTDLPAWARDTIWYGRRQRRFLKAGEPTC